jgi:hypothetical protein
MTRHTLTLGAVVAAFILSQAPAFGQSRPNTTGSSSGTAAPRGGDTGSSGSTGSSTGSSTTGSSVSGTASSRPSTPAMPSGGGSTTTARERAPQRPMAVPRGAAGADPATVRAGAPATRMSPAEAGARAVPTYSRPRDGRTALGGAVERHEAPQRPGDSFVIVQPYYRYGYYGPYGSFYGPYGSGYGLGLGYYGFGYDPFFLGGTYYGAPSYSAGGYSSPHRGTGKVRLRVQPAHAEVYVDGYFVGTVNDFNGLFQRLNLDAGPHRLELRAEGYETVEFEVFITHGETITYRGEMKPRVP